MPPPLLPFFALALTVLLIVPGRALAADVRVAVASNFLLPLKSLAADFEKQSGHRLRISAGSTGKLYAQIVNGAPFDVFLSANAREPKRLVKEGLSVSGSQFTYARGRLALWAGGEAIVGEGSERLCAGEYRRLAIANPRTAPYGAAAVAVLKNLHCLAAARSRLIRGENISQAYQFVASGNAQLGLVALSQLADAEPTTYWPVPMGLHDPIDQDAVLLKRAENSDAAKAFLAFLRSESVVKQLQDFGYGT